MVKVDLANVTINGNSNMVSSEASLLLHAICAQVSERGGIEYDEVMDNILRGAKIYPLTDAGMSISEAMEVIGMDVKKINVEESVIPKGQL